jgi:glycolate oxidase iron-sulfur subunit
VQYGQILEQVRERLGAKPGVKRLVDGLSEPARLRLQLGLARLWPGTKLPGFVSRTLTDEPPEARLPRGPKRREWPPLEEASLPSVRGEVAILEGCVMRVLFPDVHVALRRLLRRVGFTVREVEAGCCGALHAHVGLLDGARERLDRLMEAVPEGVPLIVDSAGCGSHLKEALPPGRACFDATEFLDAQGLGEALAESRGVQAVVSYHDACHLAHGQRIKDAPRRLIRSVPGLRYVELPEADVCCGSAGVYNLTQPAYARALLDRKWATVQATGAEILATGNPGCHSWIQQASEEQGARVRVMHTLELLEASFSGNQALEGAAPSAPSLI